MRGGGMGWWEGGYGWGVNIKVRSARHQWTSRSALRDISHLVGRLEACTSELGLDIFSRRAVRWTRSGGGSGGIGGG